MHPMELAIVLIPLVIATMIALIVFGARAAARRRNELAAWAASRGLDFQPRKDPSFRSRYPNFSCLDWGSQDRYALNIMTGQMHGRRCTAFDYHYETESRDSKGNRQATSHYFSAVILESDLFLKPLFILPERLLDKVSEFFGYDDIDFESAEFSRKFYVKAPDKRWAFDVIHQRTMQFLLDQPRFSIEFDIRHVIAYRSSTFKPADFEAAAATLAGILDGFPEYLRRQLKEGV